jgi:hypothetical protein
LYLLSVSAQQSGTNPAIELRDYCDPITETSGHQEAPALSGQPSWPNVGSFYTRFAKFSVLIDQPIRTRKGVPTSIELKLTEI